MHDAIKRLESRRPSRPDAHPDARPGTRGEDVAAWEMIEAGRYMPRRIKGSFPGRELG